MSTSPSSSSASLPTPNPDDVCPPDSPPASPSSSTYAFPVFLLSAAAAVALTSFLSTRRRRPASIGTRTGAADAAASTGPTKKPADGAQQHADPPPLSPPAACALARAWLAADPDPATRAHVSAWLTAHLAAEPLTDPAALAATDRLPDSLDPAASRLRFGTAGVRAQMGPGYDRLNALTVVMVAQAVATMSPAPADDDAAGAKGAKGADERAGRRPVVIGHDARRNSRAFALLIAQVFHHHGRPVQLFSAPVPTPLVAFHARRVNAVTALCVTASHNPPADNGIKVFWTDAIQVRPAVARRVEAAMPGSLKPWKEYSLDETDVKPLVHDPLAEASAAYIEALTERLRLRTPTANRSAPPMVYTACHGVGLRYVADLFSSFGLPSIIPCRAQCAPDPAFPTLPFPNPEEPGVLDRAVETARGYDAPLILANDPDADRFAAAELQADGSVRVFNGNEIAALLADYLTAQVRPDRMADVAVVTSAVSSKRLASMARARGFEFHETLTGFKWINKKAVDLEEAGKNVVLSYEEAIGYNVTQNLVRDKCGISAAAVFGEIAATVYDNRGTLVERLKQIDAECGVHLSYNGYLRVTDESSKVAEIFDAARKRGLPKQLADMNVVSYRDLTKGTDTGAADGKSEFDADPDSQFITLRCAKPQPTAKGASVTESDADDTPLIIHLRGSGTEPKIKYYSELRCSVEDAEDGSGRELLEATVERAIADVLRPDEHKLQR